MKEKIYKPKDYPDTYFDLSKKSIIQMKSFLSNKPLEEIVGYNAVVKAGSFLNKNAKEFLLHIVWNWPTEISEFGHADNFGPLNQFIVFDNKYNQISDVFFQHASKGFVDIIDIGNTGINELVMEGNYCGQGYCQNYIEVFYKDFENPALFYISNKECLNEYFLGEYDGGKSDYKIDGNKFIININKYTNIRLSENDLRKTKEENCTQVYLFENGIFKLLQGKDCGLDSY
jgi:hypothetical protein